MSKFAQTPKPPYYSVFFASQRSTEDDEGYAKMADHMWQLASDQPGYIGMETVRGDDGFGMTVSYWESLETISNWRKNSEHKIAQAFGKKKWYNEYKLRIALVERDFEFERS